MKLSEEQFNKEIAFAKKNVEEGKKDTFDITYGNLVVLRKIPDMMVIPEWRNKLRDLVLEYISKELLK